MKMHKKLLPPGLLLLDQICTKSFVGRRFAYSAPQAPSWFRGGAPGKREGGRGGEKEGGEGKEGSGGRGEEGRKERESRNAQIQSWQA